MVFCAGSLDLIRIFDNSFSHASEAASLVASKSHPGKEESRFSRAFSILTDEIPTLAITCFSLNFSKPTVLPSPPTFVIEDLIIGFENRTAKYTCWSVAQPFDKREPVTNKLSTTFSVVLYGLSQLMVKPRLINRLFPPSGGNEYRWRPALSVTVNSAFRPLFLRITA